MDLLTVYHRLRAEYGHRGWWPVRDAFGMIVSAYLTQNVAWRNVEAAMANLGDAGLLHPPALAAAPAAAVQARVRPAGFFRQKAERLQHFARYLMQHYDGDPGRLLARPCAALRAELLALPGIGPETADSILCYAAGYPVLVVDAYTARIGHRLGWWPTANLRYEDMQPVMQARLPRDAALLSDFHAQLVHLGHNLCHRRQPRCHRCPLLDMCDHRGRAEAAPALPVRVVYKDKRHSSGTIRGGTILLYISRRLPRSAQQEHIRQLTQRLQARAARLQDATGHPAGLTPSPVTDDGGLLTLAQDLNQRYYGFHLQQVRFKAQRSRWGSCSGRTGNIYISDRLRGGPHELLEYVLIHEICHLAELNHGPRFWRLVARACPDWRERRRWLRAHEAWSEGAQGEGSMAGPPGGKSLGRPDRGRGD